MSASPQETKALFEALKGDRAAEVAALLRRNPSVLHSTGPQGLPPLLAGAYYRAHDATAVLLRHGAKADVFSAAALGLEPEMRELLARDPSSLGTFSPDGWTPLHLAAHFGRVGVVELLLRKGADLRAVARNGVANQPLQAAIANGQVAAARALLAAGAPVDARSHANLTALHLAAEGGDLDGVRLLLDAGADPSARSAAGTTARDLAAAKHHEEVVRVLAEAVGPARRPSPPPGPRGDGPQNSSRS